MAHTTSRAAGRILHVSALAMATALTTPALTTPAMAQDNISDQTATASQQAGTGSDIIVTARRREEDLSRVPIAITAMDSNDLVERAVVSDADLQRTVPGLTIRQTQGNNSLTYSLRGQSADIFSGSPSAVITYFNEVPIPVSQSSSFFDLQSIQVLKGPQGTLFGRNATGGAVLFTSIKPSDEFEGYVRGRYGNYDRVELEGAVNLPMGEIAALRIAGNLTYRDGYIDNLYTGDTLGDINRESLRASLRLTPADGIENTTVVQYSNSHGTNTGASYTYSVYSPGETNNGYALTTSSGFLFSPLVDVAFGEGAWDAYLAEHPKAYAPGLPAYVEEQKRLGLYKTNHPSGARHFGENWAITNTTEFELNDDLKFRNIFGYIDSFVDSQQPQLGAPFATILTENLATGAVGNEEDLTSWSEEIQLQGEAMDGALEFILGAYFQRQKTVTQFPQTYFELAPLLPYTPATNRFRIKNHTDAIYGQASFEIVENLTVTAGLRYTWEKVFGLQLPGSDNFGPPQQKRSYSDPSWEAGLEYQLNPDVLVYAKTRGSFRSGGYNGTLSPTYVASVGASNFFDSETTEDVELGFKYGGLLFGRPATFNVALFQQWIHDVQRVEFPDPDGPDGPVASIAITTNVPEERVRGLEAELAVYPVNWLQIGGQLALTDADYTDGDVVLFGTPFSYGPVGDTPKTSGTAWMEFFLPVDPSLGDITLRGEVYAQDGQYFSNAADSVAPRTRLPGYALVNLRAGWRNIMESPFSAALFANNVFKEEYFAGGMQLAVALGHNAAVVGEPRMYGLELSFEF
jgi:iron complex outermembrane recepter protein